MKQLTKDPWENIQKEYSIGKKIKAKISNIADYGSFVELKKGVEGLIHVSEMSWTNKNAHPSTFMKIGDELEVSTVAVGGLRGARWRIGPTPRLGPTPA